MISVVLLEPAGGAGPTSYEFALQKGAVTSSAVAALKQELGAVWFDPTKLTATGSLVKHVYFECVLEASNAANSANVDLLDAATGVVIAGSTLTTTALVPTKVSVELPALAAVTPRVLQVRLWMGAASVSEIVACLSASLLLTLE